MTTPPPEPRTSCGECGQLVTAQEWHTFLHCTLHKTGVKPADSGIALSPAEAAGAPLREARDAALDIAAMTVDHLDDPRMSSIHKAASRILAALAATPAPAPLDVEALAEAIYNVTPLRHVGGIGEPDEWASAIAPEYDRLTARTAATEDTT